MTIEDLKAQTIADLSAVFDSKQGRRVALHLMKVFGDCPTKQAPVSGDQMRGRSEVIQYIIKHADLIGSPPLCDSDDE